MDVQTVFIPLTRKFSTYDLLRYHHDMKAGEAALQKGKRELRQAERQLALLLEQGWMVLGNGQFEDVDGVNAYFILHHPGEPPIGALPFTEADNRPDALIAVPETPFSDNGDRSLDAFKALIRRGEFVILDTETTGLNEGEICQIALINARGEVLLDTLVKPTQPIPADATRIHGITNDDVAAAPDFRQLRPALVKLLTGRDVVVYNATYDRKMLHKSAEAAGLPHEDYKAYSRWWCAMEAFAEVYGDWNSYRQSYRWKKLVEAAAYYKLPVQDAHSALGDCRMTLQVVRHIAGLDIVGLDRSAAADF